jgi:hypothetical protein
LKGRSKLDIEIKKTIEHYQNDPRTKEVIEDIKLVIYDLGNNFTKLNEIIKELAGRIYEDGSCEKEKISQVIKYILIDKIKEGKISKKWIEKSLPSEYKRRYITQRRENSLSNKSQITIRKDNNGTVDVNNESNSQIGEKSSNQSKSDFFENANEFEQIKELQDALSKTQQMVAGDQILTENSQFVIPKEYFQILKKEMEKSNRECYLKFAKNKVVREIFSDTFKIQN